MKFLVEIKNNGDMLINNEFAGQACYEPEAAGSALAAFLNEAPESVYHKPLDAIFDEETIEAAYRIREHQYLLADAVEHLKEWFDENSEEYADLVSMDSDAYALESLVESFERQRDCNIPENSTWDNIVFCEYLKWRSKG